MKKMNECVNTRNEVIQNTYIHFISNNHSKNINAFIFKLKLFLRLKVKILVQ